jgi:hypothetical protein
MSARALSLLAAGLLLLIAGCSGGDRGSAVSAPTPGTPALSSPSPAAPPPTATTSARQSTSAKPAAGAIERYEVYLHALGRQDVATACEVAGPAAKKAEDQGLGPCQQTFPMMFQLVSPAQKRALQAATVDRARVLERSATKVEIPATAVRASTSFTDSDLGDATLEYLRGQWYVTD